MKPTLAEIDASPGKLNTRLSFSILLQISQNSSRPAFSMRSFGSWETLLMMITHLRAHPTTISGNVMLKAQDCNFRPYHMPICTTSECARLCTSYCEPHILSFCMNSISCCCHY